MELLVAAICLAVASLAITSALRFSNDRINQAEWRMTALNMARDEMELARSRGVTGVMVPGSSSRSITVDGMVMTVTTTVSLVAGELDVYAVDATVTYQLAAGRLETIVLDTQVRNGSIS